MIFFDLGPTGSRTRVAKFKVWSANLYTIEPTFVIRPFISKLSRCSYNVLRDQRLLLFTNDTSKHTFTSLILSFSLPECPRQQPLKLLHYLCPSKSMFLALHPLHINMHSILEFYHIRFHTDKKTLLKLHFHFMIRRTLYVHDGICVYVH